MKGAITKYNMRSLGDIDEREVQVSRPYRSVVQENEEPSTPHVSYNNFDDFSERTEKLTSLADWIIITPDGCMVFSLTPIDFRLDGGGEITCCILDMGLGVSKGQDSWWASIQTMVSRGNLQLRFFGEENEFVSNRNVDDSDWRVLMTKYEG